MELGFVGLGNMGAAMAGQLLSRSHTVVAYNRSRPPVEALAASGAVLATTPGDAARCRIVITMLADDHAVESMVFGPEGILAHLPPGGIHVSMSTISVSLARRLAEEHVKAEQQFVCAPVFGRPEAAARSMLFVVAAGPGAAIEQIKPALEAMSQRIFIVGEEGWMANMVKLSGNFLIASTIESLAEAFALIRKAGIEPEQFLEVLTSTLFTAPVHKTYGNLIARETFEPAGFRLPLGLKDVRLALEAANDLAVPMPFASVVRDQLLSGIARGYEEQDWSALARVAAENAGVESADQRP